MDFCHGSARTSSVFPLLCQSLPAAWRNINGTGARILFHCKGEHCSRLGISKRMLSSGREL